MSARGVESPSGDSLKRVATILREGKERTTDDLVERLLARGAVDVPAIFETLRLGSLDAAQPEAGAHEVSLSELQQRALLDALKRMPQSWRALFQEFSHSESARPERAAALRVIGEIGAASDVSLMLDLARTAPALADSGESVDPQFQSSVEKLLGRDVHAFGQFETLFFAADAPLRPLLVQAISNAGTLAAVEVLAHLLGKDGELDVILMTGISHTAASLAAPFDARIEESVRNCLTASSENLVREAALAVGKLEDADALPMLVTLLSHSNRGVRENALWSLKKISGLCFAANEKAWSAWLKVEQNWWRESAPALFSRLETAKRPEALAIVQEVARRRYPRHPLAAELSRALSHPDNEVRRLTCVALGEFRSRTAVPALLVCLDDADPDVRIEAGRALHAVTGEDLPPVRAAWTRAGY